MSLLMSPQLFFYMFAAIAIGSAIGVVLARNPVGSLLFMVTTLASIAGLFVLFEAHFLAAIQVMVYAGAIMVLFLFVIMLLNLGHDSKKDIRGTVALVASFAVVGGMVGVLVQAFRGPDATAFVDDGPAAAALDQLVMEKGAVGAIADPLFQQYVVAFELTGILLLIAIVGAIAVAKTRV